MTWFGFLGGGKPKKTNGPKAKPVKAPKKTVPPKKKPPKTK